LLSKRFSLILILTLSVMLILVNGCAAPVNNQAQLESTNQKIQQAIQSGLDSFDADLSGAVSGLARTGLNGPGARQILNGLCSKYPFLIDCLAVDAAGKVTAAAPEAYLKYEGTDLKTQDIKKATLSTVFKAVEGMDAVSLMRPILSEKGEYLGIISALFKPETFLAGIVGPLLKGTDEEFNVTQLDGLNIFDSQGADIGMNFITDPAILPYKDLITLNTRIAAEESGTGNYTYLSHKTEVPVKKLALWSSVKLHDTAWRLISVQEVAE
jgi:hypothetical protein